MKFRHTPLDGAYLIELEPFTDDRGWFARTYSRKEFDGIGHKAEWVQQNHSFTVKQGTVRGMHFQLPPFSEIKMVQCVAGRVYDVIVDLREGSPTFLQSFGAELSAENRTMMFIPKGFAHGFQTMEDNTALVYNHSEEYQSASEGGLRFSDPLLAIKWPLNVTLISDRDRLHPYIDKNFKGINTQNL